MKYKHLNSKCCRNCIYGEIIDSELYKCNFSNRFHFRSIGKLNRWTNDACSLFRNKYKLI